MSDNPQHIGVIGAGSFGTAIANLLAENNKVLIYARRQEVVDRINKERMNARQKMADNITATVSLEEVTGQCDILYPMLPSSSCAEVFQNMAPLLRPDHILIHGTKGFVLDLPDGKTIDDFKTLSKEYILPITELIHRKTVVIRVGVVSGPNLSAELAAGQPAGAVVASRFDEVIKVGRRTLKSQRFQVFGSNDMTGVELAGTLKNIIAIASGALSGLDMGDNARSLLIAKSLSEMVRIGKMLGADVKSFLGVAGIGDIIATASSSKSRNFTVGYRLAQGETLQHIIETSEEVAEGVYTVKIVKKLADHYRVRVPIIQMIHKALYEDLPVKEAIDYLMRYPFEIDVDFMD